MSQYPPQRPALASLTNTLSSKPAPRKSLAKPAQRQSIVPAPTSARKSSIGTNLNTVGRPSNIGPRLSVARQSVVGSGVKSRPSSIYGRGKTGKTDPRTFSDKQFQVSCIRALVDYVSSHGFTYQLSQKILSAPSARDFANILQFLYRQIDPHYTLEKLDEDVPTIFTRVLRYPFAISKSSLASVGTPHTWPSLLAALAWLVELLCYEEASELQDSNTGLINGIEDVSDALSNRKMMFEWIGRAYVQYMSGDDNFVDIETTLSKEFDIKNATMKGAIERLSIEKEKIEQKINFYTNEPDPITELEKKKITFSSDIVKFRKLVETRIDHKGMLEKKMTDLTKDLEARESELESSINERNHYLAVVTEQSANAADLEKLCSDKNSLEEQLSSIGGQRESLEKMIYEKEIQISKKLEEVEKLVQHFNGTARKMQLVPSSTKYAKGINYQITFNPHSPEHLVEQLKSTVKPSLESLKESSTKGMITAREEFLNIKEKNDRCEEAIADKKDEVAALEKKIQQLELSYNKEKEMMRDHLKQKQLEVDSILQEVNRMKDSNADNLTKSQYSLAHLKEEYETLASTCANEKNEALDIFVRSLEFIGGHKSHISESLIALQRHCSIMQERATRDGPKFQLN